MTGPPAGKTLFLERASYRRRRVRDGARILPLVALILWLIPLFWAGKTADPVRTVIYLFVVWVLMIVAAALFSMLLRRQEAPPPAQTPPD